MADPKSEKTVKLSVDKLVIGLYVDLGLSWTEHPFLFKRFRIKTAEDLTIIRSLPLTEVTVYPERSEAVVPTPAAAGAAEAPVAPPQDLWKAKQEKIEKAEQFRAERRKVTARYNETVKKVRKFTENLRTTPANAMRDAEEVIETMAAAFEQEGDTLMNLINLSDTSFSLYNHALNVSVLSLSLARAMGIKGAELRHVGIGGLLHDVGKILVPGNITHKKTKLTGAEQAVLNSHPILGGKLSRRIQTLPKEVVDIIEQHHELLDGSGYPQGLKAAEISLPGQIVAVANLYDNLCNPEEVARALTPKAALAMLYAKYRGRLDSTLIEFFVKTMGIYPPGTLVKLNDESIGLVVSVDPKAMTKPTLILYNPDIPRKDALMINLQEHPDLAIADVIKPADYPSRVYEYLGLKDRVGYFHSDPVG